METPVEMVSEIRVLLLETEKQKCDNKTLDEPVTCSSLKNMPNEFGKWICYLVKEILKQNIENAICLCDQCRVR